MSSYLQEQKRLIEEKKRQVMERASLKKDNENKLSMSSQATVNTAPGPTQSLLVNDGNFLARFKAMQEEAKQKMGNEDKDKNPGKLTINLSGVRKKTVKPITSSLPKPSAFSETQEESTEGKFSLLLVLSVAEHFEQVFRDCIGAGLSKVCFSHHLEGRECLVIAYLAVIAMANF